MEECCTCNCGNQTWTIYYNRIECAKCGRETDMSAPDLKPTDLLALVNNQRLPNEKKLDICPIYGDEKQVGDSHKGCGK